VNEVNRMVGKLEGKVAIVTGGSGGFGLGIVQKFVKEGAKVVIFDINADGGKRAEAANPGSKFVQGDVSLKKDWETALGTALKEFGKLDIVCNNAGILIVKVDVCLSSADINS
jgi:3-oxoacyl-[acyl-carrier protein] reductase